MGKDFIRVTASTDIPADKDAQIRIILEWRVYDSLYRKFMSTAPLARLTDYSSFFSVTLQDLQEYLRRHPEEVNRLLPWETGRPWAGMGIVRMPEGGYEIREHDDHGIILEREQISDLAAVIPRWLETLLVSQGLRNLLPVPGRGAV